MSSAACGSKPVSATRDATRSALLGADRRDQNRSPCRMRSHRFQRILGLCSRATRMPSMTEPSGYVLEPLRKGGDFTLYRSRQHGHPSPVLAVALGAEQPSPKALRRLEHEYSLASELDPAWAKQAGGLTGLPIPVI